MTAILNCALCSNAGRYVAANGAFLCGLCAMGVDAVRLLDAGKLIQNTKDLLVALDRDDVSTGEKEREVLKSLLGKETPK